MNRYLTTSEARQKFLSLVDEVEDGDQVIITKRNAKVFRNTQRG